MIVKVNKTRSRSLKFGQKVILFDKELHNAKDINIDGNETFCLKVKPIEEKEKMLW